MMATCHLVDISVSFQMQIRLKTRVLYEIKRFVGVVCRATPNVLSQGNKKAMRANLCEPLLSVQTVDT